MKLETRDMFVIYLRVSTIYRASLLWAIIFGSDQASRLSRREI